MTGSVLAGPAEPASASEAEALAKKLSNPVADLVSVPLQFNWENGVGPDDATRLLMNLQPVVPFQITENWNLIGRFILPFINQPSLGPGLDAESGTGDIVLSGFFSPVQPGGAIWGVGPVFGLPTTTDPVLGSGKWSAGPTAVILKQSGPWTYGGLANHIWSFADTSDIDRDDVSQTFLQPFLAYTTKGAVTFGIQSESTYNWEADSGQAWTVPINVAVSKLTKFGPFPFSMQVGGGYYIDSPDGGPDWKFRMAFTLLLTKES